MIKYIECEFQASKQFAEVGMLHPFDRLHPQYLAHIVRWWFWFLPYVDEPTLLEFAVGLDMRDNAWEQTVLYHDREQEITDARIGEPRHSVDND